MPNVIKLPIIKMNGEQYFVDERLEELRNVLNPHDRIPFDEAFVRVRVSGEYIVLNDKDMIESATDALFVDIQNAYKDDTLKKWITTEPVPEGRLDDIPDFLMEDNNEC